MQVKKFEARTVKEALEMVKSQLGPEAIILAVKDNKRSFGLVGEGSVEITAAVSAATLQKKQFAESRLREADREKLMRSSARNQKQVIEKMVKSYVSDNQPRAAISGTRYIDIEDESMQPPVGNSERIKAAVSSAVSSFQASGANPTPARQQISTQPTATIPTANMAQRFQQEENRMITSLQSELQALKQTLAHFQKVPQNITGQHSGADYGLSFDMAMAFEKLTSAGIEAEFAAEILNMAEQVMPVQKRKNRALVDAWMAKYILDSVKIVDENIRTKTHLFLGPSGSGKTTTLIKMASHAIIRNQARVALATTDIGKVGALEQMKIYAQILNVPLIVIKGPEDWTKIQNIAQNFDHIFVDYPGTGLRTVDEIASIKRVLPRDAFDYVTHLVLSSLAKDSDLTELGKRYKVAGFQDVIFTNLDASVQHGNIFNFSKRFDVPLHSFGIGTNVPEDFEMATKERMLDLIFKLTKVKRDQGIEI